MSDCCAASLRATISRPRRVAVEPMDDARSCHARRSRRSGRPRASSALTSVPAPVAGRRMDDEAGGLVDDEQVVVLVRDGRPRSSGPASRCSAARARPARRASARAPDSSACSRGAARRSAVSGPRAMRRWTSSAVRPVDVGDEAVDPADARALGHDERSAGEGAGSASSLSCARPAARAPRSPASVCRQARQQGQREQQHDRTR